MSQEHTGFEQAEADLRAETNTASLGIANLTNNRGSLNLSLSGEEGAGVWYELQLHFRPPGPVNDAPRQGANRTKKYTLNTFFIPWQGYPIRTGHSLELPDRRSIGLHFVAMAKDPASPLVNYIAFNLRRQEQPAASG
jgi:hypothetical protein